MPDKSKGFPIVAIDGGKWRITGVPKVMGLLRFSGLRSRDGLFFDLVATQIAGNLDHRQSVQVGATMSGTVRLAKWSFFRGACPSTSSPNQTRVRT